MSKRLEPPQSTSIHVYLPHEPTLERSRLVALLRERGWRATSLDPSDRRPLDGGLLWDDLISVTRPQEPSVFQECQVVTQSPFDVAKVLGDIDSLKETFGERGAEILGKARAVQTFNSPPPLSEDGFKFMMDLAEVVAIVENGWIYDCQSHLFK